MASPQFQLSMPPGVDGLVRKSSRQLTRRRISDWDTCLKLDFVIGIITVPIEERELRGQAMDEHEPGMCAPVRQDVHLA